MTIKGLKVGDTFTLIGQKYISKDGELEYICLDFTKRQRMKTSDVIFGLIIIAKESK